MGVVIIVVVCCCVVKCSLSGFTHRELKLLLPRECFPTRHTTKTLPTTTTTTTMTTSETTFHKLSDTVYHFMFLIQFACISFNSSHKTSASLNHTFMHCSLAIFMYLYNNNNEPPTVTANKHYKAFYNNINFYTHTHIYLHTYI